MVNLSDGGGASSSPVLQGPPNYTNYGRPTRAPKTAQRTLPRKRVSAPRRYTSNQGRQGAIRRRVGGNYAGTRRHTTYSAPKAAPSSTSKLIRPVAPPAPALPSAGTFLAGDSTYQRQMLQFAKSLADFKAEQGLASAGNLQNYQGTLRDIGLAKGEALKNLESDYASRGLLHSSLYNTDVGELNQEYGNQYTDANKARLDFLKQLGIDLTKYQGEQTAQQQNARAEALRRRAEKYNL